MELVIIGDLYGRSKPVFSFEFFPPKTDAAAEELFRAAAELKQSVAPDFVSVTYGAGGSTRTRTLEIVTRIQRELGVTAMAHLAGKGHTREEIHEVVSKLVEEGVRNVLALRGDPPKNGEAPEGDFDHATDLIEFLSGKFDVGIGAACYPETHPEASSADDDLNWAKRKADLGARFLITQLFFNNQDYFRYVERLRSAGVSIPIVPGIMPITNLAQIERFTKMCGASIAQPLYDRLCRYREDGAAVMAIGLEHAIEQCKDLLKNGAPGLHFYTLNKSLATRVILTALKD